MQNILKLYQNHPKINDFSDLLKSKKEITLINLKTSARSFFLASSFENTKKSFLIILSDKEAAAYLYNDFQKIILNENIFFFPSTIRHLSYNSGLNIDKAAMMMRTETLTKIRKLKQSIIISYPQAIAENVISANEIPKNTIEVKVGDEIDTFFLVEMLEEFGFQKTEFVIEPGQYSVRGGIFDVFSYAANFPYRLDFFGDEIENIRIFDVETQLSTSKIEKISIVSNIQTKKEYKKIPFLEFIDANFSIFTDDEKFLFDTISEINEKQKELVINNDDFYNENTIIFSSYNEFKKKYDNFQKIYFSQNQNPNIPSLKFDINYQAKIQKNFNLLANDLEAKHTKAYKTFIMSKSEKQLLRLQEILKSEHIETKTEFKKLKGTIHEGFTDNDLKISAYTDHQIFDRFHKFKLKDFGANKSKEKQLLKEINELNPGDYIVHIDYGIGIFMGLTTIENNGKKQEVVRITYKDNDNLFVSIHALNKISKFKSQDAEPPRIHKLGTKVWKNLKKKTKSRIKDIAKDLIELYAKRMQEKGFAYAPDSYLQEALEASFIYEETPDQLKTITDV
ncbi:MAG: CarD family transcriptional regulator, partial [Bacteroidota bacterium]|nr:CarD family transcriptional regulator [Bacteroidota bacterium]